MNRNLIPTVLLPLGLLSAIGVVSVAGCGGGGAKEDVAVVVKASGTDVAEAGSPDEAAAVPSGEPGALRGKITVAGTFDGLPPLIRKGDKSAKDAEVCAADDVPNEDLVVGPGGGIRDVFVFMDKVPRQFQSPAPEDPAVFDQKVCRFLPHAMVVRVGQPVQIWNSDAAAHNTHTKPKVNSEFNSVVKAEDQSGSVTFAYRKPEKEPIPVVCDFHSWMKAWHLPVDHPYAVVTNDSGEFEISGLPPGKYRFKVFHSGKYLERKVEVTIKSGAATELNLSYGADKLLAN